ncbi:MAG: hypothetical protein ABSC38_06245 [Verrucomicrobiia bacterium]
MRMKNWLIVSIVGCVLLLGSAHVFAAPVTGQVFQLNATLNTADVEETSPGKTGIVNRVLSTQNIINIVLDNTPTDIVPPNQVLALVISTEPAEAALIVLDTSTTNNLATIAEFMLGGWSIKTKGTIALGGFIRPAGGAIGALSNGFIGVNGNITVSPTNPLQLTGFKSKSVMGILHGVAFGQEFDALITKGKVSTVREWPAMPISLLPD